MVAGISGGWVRALAPTPPPPLGTIPVLRGAGANGTSILTRFTLLAMASVCTSAAITPAASSVPSTRNAAAVVHLRLPDLYCPADSTMHVSNMAVLFPDYHQSI
jgi:hypothetical protein